MARTVKTAEERKNEIIKTSEKLFNEKGFNNTSVESIIKEIGVAKGTFYYYFKSKEEVLKAIVDLQLDQIAGMAEQVACDKSMDAMAKMELLLSGGQMGDEKTEKMTEHLHLPGNRELHEEINIQTVLKLSPVFAEIIRQGNEEKVFHAERPLETIRFLLAGAQFLLDGGLFHLTNEEEKTQRAAMQHIVECALGAAAGSFSFLGS